MLTLPMQYHHVAISLANRRISHRIEKLHIVSHQTTGMLISLQSMDSSQDSSTTTVLNRTFTMDSDSTVTDSKVGMSEISGS